MSNLNFKERFISALYQRDGPRPIVRGDSYVVRCPYCGDSADIKKAHFYITVHMDDQSPILYNCFRCPVGGILTTEVMRKLELQEESLYNGVKKLNKNAVHYDKKAIGAKGQVLLFDYTLPDIQDGPKLEYIRKRLGIDFTFEDFKKMKVITSLKAFLIQNKIKKLTCHDRVAYFYENCFVGFLSHGGGYILLRDITGKSHIPWIKYPITSKSKEGVTFYSLESSIDIFTEETITVNLAEGVFDILGVYYHFQKSNRNTVNIAVTGKQYESVCYYLIRMGILGSNVVINIFSDNDERFNQKNRGDDTSLEYYRKLFSHIKYLFKAVYVYYNELGKDCGVPRNEISLVKNKI